MATIGLKSFSTSGRLLGTRTVALSIRDIAERALDSGEKVEFDFAGTNPTQSFIDELIGALVMDRGAEILRDLTMKNCSHDIKNILHFVVSDRIDQMKSRTLVAM